MIVTNVKIHCCYFGGYMVQLSSVSNLNVGILGGTWYNCHQCQTSMLPFLEVCAVIVIGVKLHCCHGGGGGGGYVLAVPCHLCGI